MQTCSKLINKIFNTYINEFNILNKTNEYYKMNFGIF